VRAKPLNTRTAGTDTNTLSTFTLLPVGLIQTQHCVESGQKWMRF